ncbi:MAG TPA: cyclic nucleotide-binding domain-containing protein [Candidatus Sulfotelmatobacter sp.]|jgi:CRP-like cAMP-binding protein|nr:cyclic nucleotide-binding domain-containing protein [Candidatus Sulfotelmatobacter sp.]
MNIISASSERGLFDSLRKTPLFAGLAENDLAALTGEAMVETYSDGVVLFEAGQVADRFFVVLDGHVELFLLEAERHNVLEVAGKSLLLGETALFLDGGGYPHSARTVGYAKLLAVPARPFMAVLQGRFDLTLRMLGSMSMRLRGLIEQITRLKLKNTAQRLAAFLLALTPKTEGQAVVRFPYDKRLAADSLGMSAESLSRALLKLGELGVESRPDNLVAIHDLALLQQYCLDEAE